MPSPQGHRMFLPAVLSVVVRSDAVRRSLQCSERDALTDTLIWNDLCERVSSGFHSSLPRWLGTTQRFRRPEGGGSLPHWSHQQQTCFARPKASVSLAYTPEAPKRKTPPCRPSRGLHSDGGPRWIATVRQAGCSRHAGQPALTGESRSFHIFCKRLGPIHMQLPWPPLPTRPSEAVLRTRNNGQPLPDDNEKAANSPEFAA